VVKIEQILPDESTWIAVSRDGHNWIHDNPKEAREKKDF
jgi:hypothetical protein